ncbi:MAG: hypothetical protein QOG21_1660 [Actinomycetota bacterium]|nr:hypothetical protein [Actinomycetota bacterium]
MIVAIHQTPSLTHWRRSVRRLETSSPASRGRCPSRSVGHCLAGFGYLGDLAVEIFLTADQVGVDTQSGCNLYG